MPRFPVDGYRRRLRTRTGIDPERLIEIPSNADGAIQYPDTIPGSMDLLLPPEVKGKGATNRIGEPRGGTPDTPIRYPVMPTDPIHGIAHESSSRGFLHGDALKGRIKIGGYYFLDKETP